MDQNPTMKLAAAVATLVGIWVGVYWMWQPARAREASIQFPDERGGKGTADRTPTPTPTPTGAGAAGDGSVEGGPLPGPNVIKPSPTAKASDAVEPKPSNGKDAVDAGAKPDNSKTAAGDAGKSGVIVKPPKFEEYRIQQGETFESIARKRYGSSAKADAIKRANPFVDPTKLKPGRLILLPVDPGNIQGRVERTGPAREGWKSHKVVDGETLSEISKKYYGTVAHTRRIYEANRDRMRDENFIKPGLELDIPPAPGEKKSGEGGR